ncbi:caspase family protein [Haliscomenobacter hydrossis]|uniref:Peptidase C14 caspase catalytic subunit p20 n=1 Tax=Haliscomenobacter hydrossis (strain ATCC 27775 / DSM 1100 / LMG 10767 / O) TaxID=760192 RepID=F4L1Q1_HALH1|nr:caspase family protein [Haliscomenobacter hydrossis]AEE49560.1 peptidase C14 caspase catalytic subunit p20 [Haliscomenobacter hydrossis DSM 1100]
MKIKLLLCCILMTSLLLRAQDNKNTGEAIIKIEGTGSGTISTKTRIPVRLDWVSPKFPKPGEIVSVYRKINIEVKAITEADLKDGDFKVFVDNKPLENKSGEAPLIVDKVKKEYIFRSAIEIPADEERHAIRVECNNNGVLEKSKTIILQSTNTAPSIFINWKSPDVTELAGRTYLHTDPFLELAADIETGGAALDLSQIRVRHNGVDYPPNPSNATLKVSGSRYSFKYRQALLNSAELQSVSIKALGFESDLLTVRYNSVKKPNLYLLSIGTQTNLAYTVQDALDFAALFAAQKAGNTIYNDVVVEQLIKERASTQEIRKAINRLNSKMNTSEINPNDLVIVFISTHGFISADGDFRLQGDDFSSDAADATSVSFENDVMKVMKRMTCKKLIFMDACHSGGAFDPKNGGKGTAADVESALEKYNEFRSGTAILASSQANEISYEDPSWKNGAFTEAIIKGLGNGEADANANNIITISELAKFLEKKVPELVTSVKGIGKKQRPRLHDPDQIKELPIFIKK